MSKNTASPKNKNGALSSFRQPQFNWLFASNMAFFFAMGGQSIVRAWLAFKLTESELALGMVMFAVAIPMFFFGPIGGVVADRRDRRVAGSFWVAALCDTDRRLKRMMISMFAFGIFLFCIAVSPWFLLGLPLVFIANVFVSVYSTLNNTAIQLVIPDQIRGRISSFLMMSFSLPLLGTLPVAAVAEVYGASFAVGLTSYSPYSLHYFSIY